MSDLKLPPHQMGHDPERDAVYLAALTGIIANPHFFGATYQGHPGAAADFASAAVAKAFGDAMPGEMENDLLGSLRGLVEVIRKAGVHNLSNGVQLGQISWAIKANDALERADRAIGKAQGAACDRCGGRGEIGGAVGQTPETFEWVTEPCPDCVMSAGESS